VTLALQALTPAELTAAVPAVTLAEARKIIAMVHRDEPVHASSAVRRVAADAVRAAGEVPRLSVVEEAASAIDPFVKYQMESGGQRFETVRIPLADPLRFSVCVSSQVGCALACRFCATGRMGLTRNLHAWEIVEQVREVRRRLPRGRVHGVVFQGMGEPLANFDAVVRAIRVLSEPCAQGIDGRAITVCTSGLPQQIRRLAQAVPAVRLGVSLGSARIAVRKRVMPIDDAHGLEEVLDAAAEHAIVTGHSPMWAVTLLAGVNDSDEDAVALASRARAFEERTGRRPRLSIIAYNSIGDDDPFARSSAEREAGFRAVLSAHGLANHRRYSGGSDIAAACGQLVALGGTPAPRRAGTPALRHHDP
jgi:23S rRNA (adenine2503-C2)-methyltransferase